MSKIDSFWPCPIFLPGTTDRKRYFFVSLHILEIGAAVGWACRRVLMISITGLFFTVCCQKYYPDFWDISHILLLTECTISVDLEFALEPAKPCNLPVVAHYQINVPLYQFVHIFEPIRALLVSHFDKIVCRHGK